MQLTPTDLTGSDYRGNYIWSIAMNLAWNELCDNILKGKAFFEDDQGGQLVELFNQQLFTIDVAGRDSCLARSGYGPEIKSTIMKELAERFPGKSVDILSDIDLMPEEVLCYGYLLKSFSHLETFVESKMTFLDTKVKAFKPKGLPGRGVQVVLYNDADNFVVRLLSANEEEQIILIKGFNDVDRGELMTFVQKVKSREFPRLEGEDRLLIPNILLKHHRSYESLIGAKIKDTDLIIRIMQEQINFSLDYRGARLENEAVLLMARGLPMPKRLIFDKPFWLVMKRMDQDLPYMVLRAENAAVLEPI